MGLGFDPSTIEVRLRWESPFYLSHLAIAQGAQGSGEASETGGEWNGQ